MVIIQASMLCNLVLLPRIYKLYDGVTMCREMRCLAEVCTVHVLFYIVGKCISKKKKTGRKEDFN